MRRCPKCGSANIYFDDNNVIYQATGRCICCGKVTTFIKANEDKKDIEHIKNNNVKDIINLQESINLVKNLNVLYLILEERNRQDQKYGPQSHNPEVWQSIMAEEFGEMAQAVNETMFNNGEEKRKLGGIENIQKELIHILAVGFAMYIDLGGKK
ncbi:MAG: hypothetical protein VB017_05555 [Endomicrobiaceae bacterium]|nr:hypothetical protein [Endomicrobiaceae bacterium]